LPSGRQGDFLLREPLDAIANDVDTALIRRVQLQHSFLVSVPQQSPSKAENRRSFSVHGGAVSVSSNNSGECVNQPYTRHAGNDNVRHVSIFCDDLQSFDGLGVSDYVI
jgi:UDP-glucose 4-epimerase